MFAPHLVLLLISFQSYAIDCGGLQTLQPAFSFTQELGDSWDSTELTRRAIGYLKQHPNLPAERKAALWEGFAEVIKTRDLDWRSYRSRGSKQEWIYQGEGGHLLVITQDGRLYRSIKKESRLF